MKTAIAAIRSIAFYVCFWVQTVPLAIVVGVVAMIWGRTRFGWAIAMYWVHAHLWLLGVLCGIRTEVTGDENLPEGPCLIASKHMSDWDIFALLPFTNGRPAFIAKKELMDIPFFGHAAKSFDTIRIDRSRGGEAIPLMLEDAARARDHGCRVIIFPEGTRRAPGAEPDYKFGVVRLYEALGLPVVPMALNSGLFWGRNSLLLWPGTARAKFLEPIPPGLPGHEFRARLIAAIESETARLLLEADAAGLARPVTPELRARLEALRVDAAGAGTTTS